MIERDYYGNDERQSDLQAIRDRTRVLQQRQRFRKKDEPEKEKPSYQMEQADGQKQREEETERQVRNGYRNAKLGEKYAYAEMAEKQAVKMASKTKGKKDDARAVSVEEMLEGSAYDLNSTLETMWDDAEAFVGKDDGPDF